MNEILREKTQKWKQLERKTFEQRAKADLYYETELMKLIEEDYVERNQDSVREPVRYLVVSVGTSYEPIVLNISLFNPRDILFLYTEKSEQTLDKVVEYCNLKASAYEKRQVSEVDPIDVYKEVKRVYLKWGRPRKMHIDFTGGTKAMSAACALAGAMVDLQMIYVASDDYLVDFRKPNPGSERLVYIENPLAVFGDLESEKALELFAEYNFSGAKEKLELLKESVPGPEERQELNFIYLLAQGYSQWDCLDFGMAYNTMKELCHQLDRDGRNFVHNELMLQKDKLIRQRDYMEELSHIPELIRQKKQSEVLKNRKIMIPLMFVMNGNAWTREQQEKYDMATLLTYRLLEMIEQRRLSRYELFVSNMHYDKLVPNRKRTPELADLEPRERIEWLRSEVLQIKKEIFGEKVSSFLPNPVSLLDGFILLSALRDPIVYAESKNRTVILKRMRAMVYLRNNSIFAHGLGPVAKADYEKFRGFVLMMFQQFCKIERINYEDTGETLSWIIPGKEA